MEALHSLVVSGKVRALGASAMFGYQFHLLQNVAKENVWTQFSSMQNHYNLLYREDERELIPLCKLMNVALTPYSPLAAGRLSRPSWSEETKRMRADKVAISKYDSTQEIDMNISKRVAELATAKGVTMTEIAIAWQYAKGITAPVVGVTKEKYLIDFVNASDVKLTAEEITYLDELYIPHKIVGAIQQ